MKKVIVTTSNDCSGDGFNGPGAQGKTFLEYIAQVYL